MPLFGVVLDEYLATLGKVKDSHITDLCHARHLRPFFGDMKIGLITKDTIERYKAHRQPEILALRRNVGKNPKVVSFASVNRELTLMQGILTKAVAAGLIKENPIHKSLMFPENDKAMRVLERGEVRRLIAACKGHTRNIVVFALHTGMTIVYQAALEENLAGCAESVYEGGERDGCRRKEEGRIVRPS